MTKFGVLDGKASTHVWQNPQLKCMGNTVSAHICQMKVFRPYPVILYKLRLDHSIHWWKKWCLSEWPNLAHWMVRHLPMYDKIPNWKQREILFLLISAKLRSLDPTLLYCIDSDWTTLSICGKKLVSLGTTKFGVLDGKASTHVWQNPKLKSMGNTVSAHICQIKVFRPYPVILYKLRLDHSIHWWKKIGVPRNDQIWRIRW